MSYVYNSVAVKEGYVTRNSKNLFGDEELRAREKLDLVLCLGDLVLDFRDLQLFLNLPRATILPALRPVRLVLTVFLFQSAINAFLAINLYIAPLAVCLRGSSESQSALLYFIRTFFVFRGHCLCL